MNINPHSFFEALKSSKHFVQSSNVLEALKETITCILLEDAIRYIPSFSYYVKELYTPHRKNARIKLYKSISSIILDEILHKKRSWCIFYYM